MANYGLSPVHPTLVLALLFVMLAVTVWVFGMLIGRETHRRHGVALREWAGDHGMRVARAKHSEPLGPLDWLGPIRVVLIYGQGTTIVQGRMPDGTARHALLRRLEVPWPPTALRPADSAMSLIDEMQLRPMPATSTRRFTALSVSATAARAVTDSAIPGLLPPDLGMALHGDFFVLDFSARRFDPITLSRVMLLTTQLTGALPRIAARETAGVTRNA